MEAKLADFGLALYVGRKFFSVPCSGKRMATGQGGLTICVIFFFEAEGTVHSFLEAVARSDLMFGMDVM